MEGKGESSDVVRIEMENVNSNPECSDSETSDSTPLLKVESSNFTSTEPQPNGAKPKATVQEKPKLPELQTQISTSSDSYYEEESTDKVLNHIRKRLRKLKIPYKKNEATEELLEKYLNKLTDMKTSSQKIYKKSYKNEHKNKKKNLLHIACEFLFDNETVMEKIVKFYAENKLLQVVDKDLKEPLHIGASCLNKTALQVLLKHIDSKNRSKRWNGNTACAILLKETKYGEKFEKDKSDWISKHNTYLSINHNSKEDCFLCILNGTMNFSKVDKYEIHKQIEDCMKILIKGGVDVNKLDFQEKSPIYLAAEKGFKHLVKVILDNKHQKVDVNSKFCGKKSPKRMIIEQKLYDTEHMPNESYKMESIEKLFHFLRTKNETEFLKVLKDIPSAESKQIVNEDNQSYTLLQYACENGSSTATIQELLKKGANPNRSILQNRKEPLEMAFKNNEHKLLETIVNVDGVTIPKFIIHNPLCNLCEKKISNHDEIFESIKIVLESKNYKGINEPFSDTGYTMLYYCTHNHEIATTLLEHGAALTCSDGKGHTNFEIAEQLEIETLREHFDQCIKKYEMDIAEFDFTCLLPGNSEIKKTDDDVAAAAAADDDDDDDDDEEDEDDEDDTDDDDTDDADDGDDGDNTCEENEEQESKSKKDDNKSTPHPKQEARKEMDVIQFLSKSPKLETLLTHPLITAFLFMKWHLMRWFFFANVFIFLGFNISLYFYIFHNVTDEAHEWKYVLLVFLGLLTLKEIAEISILRTRYFFSENFSGKVEIDLGYLDFENVFEISLVILTYVIILIDDVKQALLLNEEFVKLIFVITVLLTSMALLLALEQMPYVNHKVAMIKKVSNNIAKTFVLFAIFFIPFALSFTVLYKTTSIVEGEEKPNVAENFFNSIFLSMFKTVVMMTGEYDMKESIDFEKYPIASTILFTLFVFFVAIICFNLLIGLAVSDTQAIINGAEVLSMQARTTHICYVQSLLENFKCKERFSVASRYSQRIKMKYFDSGRIVYKESEEPTGFGSCCFRILDLGVNFFYFGKLGDQIAQETKEIIRQRDMAEQKKKLMTARNKILM